MNVFICSPVEKGILDSDVTLKSQNEKELSVQGDKNQQFAQKGNNDWQTTLTNPDNCQYKADIILVKQPQKPQIIQLQPQSLQPQPQTQPTRLLSKTSTENKINVQVIINDVLIKDKEFNLPESTQVSEVLNLIRDAFDQPNMVLRCVKNPDLKVQSNTYDHAILNTTLKILGITQNCFFKCETRQ